MDLLNIFVGLALLTTGRKLFWLFVGLIGFTAGFHFAPQIWPGGSMLAVFLMAVGIGTVGAILAVFFQKLMVALAGFAAGSHIAAQMVVFFGTSLAPLAWLPELIGGVIGAVLVLAVFDWALIVLSASLGAALMVQGLQYSLKMEKILFPVLAALGMAFQISVLLMERGKRAS